MNVAANPLIVKAVTKNIYNHNTIKIMSFKEKLFYLYKTTKAIPILISINTKSELSLFLYNPVSKSDNYVISSFKTLNVHNTLILNPPLTYVYSMIVQAA